LVSVLLVFESTPKNTNKNLICDGIRCNDVRQQKTRYAYETCGF
jgi:predicted RNA-binding Zn-ribbon protein involved in translation (DUF1610 family)